MVHLVSEYTTGTGFEIEFQNLSKKKIKYITFYFTGYNSVDDPVSDLGVYKKSLKGIGPIDTNEVAKYNKDYSWFTDLVYYAKLTSVKIQYFDGTAKTIIKPDDIILSDDEL